tara:strand:- start:167 stop:1522 length:1356 start_codon:yes stop_codon:yes gene_type:complete
VATVTLACVLLLNITTSEAARSTLIAAAKGQSNLGWWCLAAIVATVLVFDFISYAQTRIFVRATEQSPTAATSFVFLLADLIASFAIFVAGFSFARLIGMLIIGQFLFNSPATTVTAFSPPLIEDAARHDNIINDITGPALYGIDSNSAIISNSLGFDKSSAASRLEYFESVILVRDVGREAASSDKYKFLDYEASLSCPSVVDKYSFDDESAYEVLSSSMYIYIFGAQQIPRINKYAHDLGEEYFARTERVMEAGLFRRLANGPSDCPLPVVRVVKKLNLRDALAGVSLPDMYLASMFSTSWEISRMIPAKFSSYHVINLSSDYTSFLSTSYDVSSRTAFGTSAPDTAKKDISEFLRRQSIRKDENVYVPFSSLSVTAIIPSLVFGIVSILRVGFWTFGIGWALAASVFPNLNVQKFIFTVLLGSSALLLTAIGMMWAALDSVWGWLWLL